LKINISVKGSHMHLIVISTLIVSIFVSLAKYHGLWLSISIFFSVLDLLLIITSLEIQIDK